MKPVSLADITYEQGLKLIAMRKQAIDSGKVRRMTKEAMANSNMLQQIGTDVFEKAAEGGWMDNIKSTLSGWGEQAQQGMQGLSDVPGKAIDSVKQTWNGINAPTRDILTKGMVGAGIGGLGGLGASALNGEKQWGRNALMGGIAGGAIGGGIGLAQNPEVSESIQNKFREMMQPADQQQAPSVPGQGRTSAPHPELKNDVDKLINIEDPELQMSQVNEKRDTADSYSPEAIHGTAAGIGAAGTGYGVKQIRDIPGFDPASLATKLRANAGSIDADALQTVLGVSPAQLQSMTQEQVESLLDTSGLRKTVWGGLAPKSKSKLQTLFRGGGKNMGGVDALDDVMLKGFRGNRPIRAGGAASLVGTAGLAGYELLQSYLEQAKRRKNAQNFLEQLKYQL